jgi:hypothetical protein
MKTTIATDYTGRIVVQPLKLQSMIGISSTDKHGNNVFSELTPDQAGALLFGMEEALRAIGCEVSA